MSEQTAETSGRPVARAHRRRRHGWSVAASLALIAGLAACGGDDDDAADSTSTSETTSASDTTTGDSTTPPEITAADDTATETDPTDDTTGDDTAPGDTAGEDDTSDDTTGGTSADGSKPETVAPGSATDTTEGSEGATAAAASESSDAADASDTTDAGSDGSAAPGGPTTTGPACEFEENTSLPLERCNMGPAVAVVQSILQESGFEVGIDGNFGDQTLYAVRAFQEEQGLTIDGIVGIQTWSELGVDERFGTDANGDGVIAPDELDLTQ